MQLAKQAKKKKMNPHWYRSGNAWCMHTGESHIEVQNC